MPTEPLGAEWKPERLPIVRWDEPTTPLGPGVLPSGSMVPSREQSAFEAPEIVYRRMDFGFDNSIPRYWHSGSPAITHFFNALSLVFPEGEKFFIESVRHFEDQIDDPRLREDVRAFVRQEAQHGRQHRAENDLAARHGLPTRRIDASVGRILGWVRKLFSWNAQLAMTIALEHFTAVFAHRVLTKPGYTEGMHSAVRALWLWHAMEETEHKAVAFDVYRQVGAPYWVRVATMLRIMIGFPLGMTLLQLGLLASDRKLHDVRDVVRGLRFVWGRDGFLRGLWPEVRVFFRRDFHPWDTDDRDLLPVYAARLAPFIVR